MTKTRSGINILGLGPGDPTQLTRAAWDFLTEIDELYVRTMQHPTLSGLPKNIKIKITYFQFLHLPLLFLRQLERFLPFFLRK